MRSAAQDERPTDVHSSGPAGAGLVLAVVAVVQFMVALDLSVVNVALPQVADGLGFHAAGVTWVINAYALTFGGLLLLGGKAADRFGHRRVLLSGLVLFGLACFIGGLAQRPTDLVAARAAQGVGAAMLAPAALSLLTATFPAGRARVRAFGVWSAVSAAGGAFGVVIGGVLTQYATWRSVMFVNVPMALGALAVARRAVPEPQRSRHHGGMDVLGAALSTGGMFLLVFGVVRTAQHGWTSGVTITTLATAVVLLVAFVHTERSIAREPLIRPGLLANRSVAGANTFNLFVGATMGASFYFISLYLQRVLGHGPAITGLEILPFGLGVVTGSVLAVRLGHRLAARTLMVAGGLLTSAGFAWFGLISPGGSFMADVLGPSLLTSIGYGLCLGPTGSTATAVAAHETGVASSLLNSSRQVGAAMGLTALGTIAAARTGPGGTPQTLTAGYGLGLTLCSALGLTAVLVATTVLPRRARLAPPPAEPHHTQPERNMP